MTGEMVTTRAGIGGGIVILAPLWGPRRMQVLYAGAAEQRTARALTARRQSCARG
jgi:hypothetical protein